MKIVTIKRPTIKKPSLKKADIKKNRVYSKLDSIPSGLSSDTITEGCLVVEGGAFRGVYAQGVMDALLEEDLNFQTVIGVSAGALGGMNYVSGQIGRSARINLKYRNDSEYVSVRHLRDYGGIINFDFLLKHAPGEPLNQERFEDERRRFVAVVANCRTGKAEFKERSNCSNILKAIQASASMPFVSRMISLDGKRYLDGGCAVKVPFQWALDEDYKKIVVIRTRHRDFRYENCRPDRMALRYYGKKFPEFAESLSLSHLKYNDNCAKLEQLEDEGRVFVIGPSENWSVGRVESDMEKLGDWYWLGYHDMKRRMEDLKAYLQK